MSDGLEIRSGGAVAVDTVSLRRAAGGFHDLAAELDEIAHDVGSAANRLFDVSHSDFGATHLIETARRGIASASEVATDIVGALLGAAAVYEIVELHAERAAAQAAGDTTALARIDARLAALAHAHPGAEHRAFLGMLGHDLSLPGDLARQAPGVLWWLAPGFHAAAVPLAWSLQRVIGAVGAGTVPAGARLRGVPTDVTVAPVARSGPSNAPRSLADAAARVPGGADARIRVERYTMSDGSRQFAVYVAGTQTTAANTREPFDMASNVRLYSGERSASYDATVAALEQAGARPGDPVHAFGHSQGAMVTTHLAMEAGYDARTLVTFGSPVEGDVGPGTLSVAIRHTDDPVAALAAGGHAGPVGSSGSFVAERASDPLPGPHDIGMPAHGIGSYIETARLLDGSTDPRMAAVRQVFDELGAAASVDVVEFSAERSAVTQPQPQPQPAPEPVSRPSSAAG
ncbi:MAG TPA: hypothetical protein VF231_05425 [Candidatus Limnocylindrales bacterium]